MYPRVRFILSILLGLLLILPGPLLAQEPVVYGIMFYSPNCSHCREVLLNFWPQLEEEFGDQLRVLFINIDSQQGIQIKRTVEQALGVESRGVPTLVIGTEVLVGSRDIPAQAGAIIRAGLDAGGIGWPEVPGIEALYEAALEQYAQEQEEQPAAEEQVTAAPSEVEQPSLSERLASDPVANAVAVLVLALLALTLIALAAAAWRYGFYDDQRLLKMLETRLSRAVLVALAVLGLLLAFSLMLGWNNEWAVLLLGGAALAAFFVSALITARATPSRPVPPWLVPVMAAAGLAVAGYLAYVELTLSDAACGAIGNCNTVQQSDYARILGVPIGVIGIAGYLAIILMWWLGRGGSIWVDRALLGLTIFGVGFSAYLTFLEPFVIGASCVWCLTSAVIMLMLLWLMTSSATAPERTPPRRLRAH